GEDGPWASDPVSYSYANRLRNSMTVQQPNASAWMQTYGHDDLGRLTSVTSSAGSFTYRYAVRFASPGGTSVATASDLVQYLYYPSGAYSFRNYDELARLTDLELISPINGLLEQFGYAYDAGSRRSRATFKAGNYVDYAYDNIGQLKTAK